MQKRGFYARLILRKEVTMPCRTCDGELHQAQMGRNLWPLWDMCQLLRIVRAGVELRTCRTGPESLGSAHEPTRVLAGHAGVGGADVRRSRPRAAQWFHLG